MAPSTEAPGFWSDACGPRRNPRSGTDEGSPAYPTGPDKQRLVVSRPLSEQPGAPVNELP